MVAAWTYAVLVNFLPAYRDTVDKIKSSTVGLENNDTIKDEEFGVVEKEAETEAVHIEK